MKKLLFIFNPLAGTGKVKACLSDMIDIFVKAGFIVTAHPTQGPGDVDKIITEYARDYDRIAVSGGDGTLDEVVTSMMKNDIHIPVGYMPTGSTNDYGSSLGIDKDLIDATNIAAHGVPYTVDVGAFGKDNYFVYVAAFGIFTRASYATPREAKNILGHGAYLFEAAKELKDVPAYRIEVEYDGNTLYDEFIYGMITNSTSVGGMTGIIPGDVSLSDGVFEVNLVKNPKNPLELSEIVSALTGVKKDSPYVYTFQASKIRFKSVEPISWTLDGEFGGTFEDIKIKNIPNALDVVVSDENNT